MNDFSNQNQADIEAIITTFKALAGIAFEMYRSVIDGGATREEARDIIEAYFRAYIHPKNNEQEGLT